MKKPHIFYDNGRWWVRYQSLAYDKFINWPCRDLDNAIETAKERSKPCQLLT